MELVDVDPRDESAFAEWFAVTDAVEQHLRPGEPGWLLHEERALSLDGQRPDTDDACELFAVRDGDRFVGAGRLKLPQVEQPARPEVLIAVLPPSAVAASVGCLPWRPSGARGRTGGTPSWPTRTSRRGGRRGGLRGAAAALGWRVAQVDVRRGLDLPLDPQRCADLAAACRPHAADYEVRTWWDSTPDGCSRTARSWTAASRWTVPKDELDWREEVWDGARLRSP
jgi:hypothetical protein